MRAHSAKLGLLLLAVAACHSDQHSHEPSSAETQGNEDPVYGTPDGTIGPNAGPGTPPPPGEGLGPGSEGPPDIVDGKGGVGGPTGGAGEGGVGGVME
jgi:hypothetical protein